MDAIPSGSENRFATIADLHELVNTLRVEISRVTNVNQGNNTITPNEEIQHLRQEVVQLREASRSSARPDPGNFASTSTAGMRISMPEKFDGTRSKFRGFLQQVKLYLRLHPLQYPDGFTQVGFIGALLSGSALSWFAPLMEKDSRLLYNLNSFLEVFTTTFGESDRERVAETKLLSLRQGSQSATMYAAEFQNLACDVDWNDKALIHQF